MEVLSYKLIVRELAMKRPIVTKLTLRRSIGAVYLIVADWCAVHLSRAMARKMVFTTAARMGSIMTAAMCSVMRRAGAMIGHPVSVDRKAVRAERVG